jgi:uncharacterized protein
MGIVADTVLDRLLGLRGRRGRYSVQRDLQVAMPDGVALLGDLYRPARADGPAPVVLIRLPYGRAGLLSKVFAGPLAGRGLQVFVQSTRGTFGSGGQFRPFATEREDGLATLDWVRAQPWCDGRVAMTGGSYFGHTQWAVAPYADPPLAAVGLHITGSRVSDVFYEHGAPQAKTALVWATEVALQEQPGLLAKLPVHPLRARRVRRSLDRLPLQAADVAAAGAPSPFWRDFIGHGEPGDDFWTGRSDLDTAPLDRMPPVRMVTGWWDLFLATQIADVVRLQDAGVPVRLQIGPWLHGEPGELRAVMSGEVDWLRAHLSDGPTPTGAPVRLHLQQAGTWLDFESWPPPATATPHFLRAGGRLDGAPPGAAAPSRFTWDPADPTPTVGGPMLQPPGKQADNAAVESRPDVLVYTGPELAADLDIAGPVRARMHVRTERPHADIFVRLCDVDAKGVSRNVVDGIRRLRPDTVPAADVQVGDDGVLTVDVELFPTAYRFRAGHRLRVQVVGGAFPRYARNFGTDALFGTGTSGVTCLVEVFHDADHPSQVILPVLT